MGGEKKATIVEIGPRDGFQNVKEFIPTEIKSKVVHGLIQAGLTKIQLTSFISPKAIPQMRDAAQLCDEFISSFPNIDFSVLVPNAFGADRAVESGVKEINYVISVSEEHNMSNVRRSVTDSFADLASVREKYPDLIINLDASMSFGCPFQGEITCRQLDEYVKRAAEIGVDAVNLCDTIGVAVPSQVEDTLGRLFQSYPDMAFDIHIHDTRNMGILNSYVALQYGVRSVQTTLGGLGGCPFAPGASGNTATEDLVYMLNKMEWKTNVDFEKLMDVARFLKHNVNGNFSGHQVDI